MKQLIVNILDWFYPMFARFMPRQTFYYAACGGGNTALSIFLFFILYNFVLKKEFIHLPFVVISPHIASMIIAFLITFPIGFYLATTIVFDGSLLKKRHQLIRYFMTTIGSVVLNYINLKIMVEVLHFYPTIAQIINTVIVVTFSYLAQKYFAFRKQSSRQNS